MKNCKYRLADVLLLCLICVLLSYSHTAKAGGIGTTGSTSLKIGVGAKATAMGEASVAFLDDVSSIHWNPAGLIRINRSQLSAMHIEWLGDIRYEWVGFAQPIADRVTIAADISYLHMGAIPRTIESVSEGYEEDGTFSPVDMALRVGFATKVFQHLLIGGSLQRYESRVSFDEVTKERISDKTAQSISIDIGCVYDVPKVPGLKVGGCFQNLGKQTKAFYRQKEPMPFAMNLGVAYEILVTTTEIIPAKEAVSPEGEAESRAEPPPGVLTVATDFSFPTDNSVSARMGVEYRFGNGIAIRGGYRTGTGFDFPSGLCGGFGYDTVSYRLDYAFVPYGDIGNTHRIAFTIRF